MSNGGSETAGCGSGSFESVVVVAFMGQQAVPVLANWQICFDFVKNCLNASLFCPAGLTLENRGHSSTSKNVEK